MHAASPVSESLFRSATRYTGPENRLTAIFAAVLARVPGAPRDLARSWTSPIAAAAGEIPCRETEAAHEALGELMLQSVRVQVPTVGGKQVDLALRFGPGAQPSADDVLIWVENKLGADPHDQQLFNYVADLPRDVRAAAVVLLAPRGSLPYGPETVPDGVPQRSWQAAGRTLQAAVASRADPVQSYLPRSLCRTCERTT